MSGPRTPRLRSRLLVIVATLLALGFVVVSFVTAFLLRGFLMQRLDQDLSAAGDRFAAALPVFSSDDDTQFDRVPGQAAGTLGARVKNGRVVAADLVAGGNQLVSPGTAAREALRDLHRGRHPRTVALPGLGTYRLLVQQGGGGDLLVTGLPVSPVQDTVDHLVGSEAIVFGAVLLATIAIGAVSVRRALRPLEDMAATAQHVAELPLSSGRVSLPARSASTDDHTEVGSLRLAFDRMLGHVDSSLQHWQDSQEQLRRFVADAGHELRTPVATVHARAEQARRELHDGRTDRLDHLLSRIEAESARMGLLVEDLLTLARVDGELDLGAEAVDLTRLVLEVVEDARLLAPEHVWVLDLGDEPVEAVGDRAALRQVLVNLVTNARTHTPAGTRVTVSARARDAEAELVVADDGPGVPDDVLPAVFERFVRGSQSRTGGGSGSGLGLAIVRGIVARHGGTVTLDSDPSGTTVRVALRAATVTSQAAPIL